MWMKKVKKKTTPKSFVLELIFSLEFEKIKIYGGK